MNFLLGSERTAWGWAQPSASTRSPGKARGGVRFSLAVVLGTFTASRGSQGPSHPAYFSPLADALTALGRCTGAQP